MVPDRSPVPPEAAAWFDATAAGVLVRDLAGNLIAWNRAAERTLRDLLDPLQGPPASWISRIRVLDEHGDPLDPATTPSTVATRTGVAIDDQVIGLVEASGLPVWVRTSARPLRDGAGRTCGAVITLEDVTERKEGEARGRVAADLLELLATAPTRAEFVDGAREITRRWTALASLELELSAPAAATDPADPAPRRVAIACHGRHLGDFRVSPAEAASRPAAVARLEDLAPLVGGVLFRFELEALLAAVSGSSDRRRSWQELELLQAAAETLGAAIERRWTEDGPGPAEPDGDLAGGPGPAGPDRDLAEGTAAGNPGRRPATA